MALMGCVTVAMSCGSKPSTSPDRPSTTVVASSTSHASTSAPHSQIHETPAVQNGQGRLAAPVEPGSRRVQLKHATLTTKNWATYDYVTGTDTVTASMPPGVTDANIREVFWRADAEPARSEQVCVTWQETSESVEGDPIQPGLAMRIASVGSGNEGIRAVTLTENVVYAGTWLFNVHVWDSRQAVPMALLQTFDVSRVVGRIANVDGRAANFMVQPPWHLCGRTFGNTFTFKVWTQDNPEPSWDDPHQVFSVELPAGWDYAGYSGGYIGHLHPGQSATATAELPTAID
ncbi:MAG TPA: hypothetical protein VFN21_04510 [Acidimicrobiales bacterium]|nr:hypothetical protein [Acidimicrobiales bacterium]